MEEIVLNSIKKTKNTIAYDFFVSDGLKGYFSGKPFVVEYPECIESVPDAVAAVPFVCNVLPIIWLTNNRLVLKELDRAFFDCIENVKEGYKAMFPESTFAGELCVERIEMCDQIAEGGSAAFFSGGLDAVHTLVSHLDEKPALISIWGSDIQYGNTEGWQKVHSGIEEYARKYNLLDVVIHSSFRLFDNEGALHSKFYEQLKDGWWHGVKHGIGLLGHAAPYAYLHGLSTVYIASSNCPADGPVRCASHPTTDNHVRFANCKVVHDGFEFSRQDKVHNVVGYCKKTGEQLSLHVCWESQSGGNCCCCEKCYRTLTAIVAEGADPREYGFEKADETLSKMQYVLIGQGKLTKSVAKDYWTHIQNRVVENAECLKKLQYWNHIQWIVKADFTRYETLKMPLAYRIRRKLSQYKFYQVLHKIKRIIKG